VKNEGLKDWREPEAVPFKLVSSYEPLGDQPQAIASLDGNLRDNTRAQTLLGVTGSGKTFTMAKVIASQNRPVLVIAPNKTLAAQLYSEFREFFPDNRIRFFISYYDYYQPEAYLPGSDTYIEKDASINEEIDKLRHSATRSVLEGRDTIIVASVSCIYGLGSPENYFQMMFFAEKGDVVPREELLRKLVRMQYTRSDLEFTRGTFRLRGESLDIFPSDQDSRAIRLIFFGDEIEEIKEIDYITGSTLSELARCTIYPVSHFVTDQASINSAIVSIRKELKNHLSELRKEGKTFEAERLERRTLYDLELMREIGFCPGVENYSRYLTGREAGEPPTTLLDYFPDDALVVIDESHVTVSQLGGMYKGDRTRKQTLVDYGFRLPSAIDNRPLSPDEFWERVGQVVFVSATPGDFELEMSEGLVVEQVNRPTGLLDPEISVRPASSQVDDLLGEIANTVEAGERVLVTTLTKKMSEDLSDYMREIGIRARYLHSDINAIDRIELLRGLRRGDFDVLIGINLLREGLDLVEVSLVAILDADKEGFLRSARSLIQTMGRASRNINGRVILYADSITRSMQEAISETERRRRIQAEFNEQHSITPRSAQRAEQASLGNQLEEAQSDVITASGERIEIPVDATAQRRLIESLKKKMFEAAARKEFETAAELRDAISEIQKQLLIR